MVRKWNFVTSAGDGLPLPHSKVLIQDVVLVGIANPNLLTGVSKSHYKWHMKFNILILFEYDDRDKFFFFNNFQLFIM